MNQIKTDTSGLKEEANTSAVNAKASENKAKEYADNLKASTDDISHLKKDLVANSKDDAKTKRSLSALWDLNKGISYRFETDTEKAYKKQVLSGAKLGAVNKIGGKTIVYNQLFDYETIQDVEMEGVIYTNNGDGSYTASGTSTGMSFISNSDGSNTTYKAYITGTNSFAYLYDFGKGGKDIFIMN